MAELLLERTDALSPGESREQVLDSIIVPEEQKAGKKRLCRIGNVFITRESFLALLEIK